MAAARSRGYAVITDTYNSAGGLAQAIPETKKLAADGWIFFMGSPITDRTILHQPYPLVIVGDYDTQGLADWVTMPNVEAVRTAVGALLDSGCRRIALIGGTAENACPDADRESRPETTSTMRTRGYVLAHEERGLQVDWRLVRNADWVQSGGRDAVAGLLDDPDAPRPDAVMCLNDALAIGVIHELQRRGVRVPQDMQVIGFDNVPDAEYCMPGLTTIDPHVDDYARHAVDMLIARIEGSADPFRTYVTSYDLVRLPRRVDGPAFAWTWVCDGLLSPLPWRIPGEATCGLGSEQHIRQRLTDGARHMRIGAIFHVRPADVLE